MPIFPSGTVNTTALLVPDLYTLVVPPAQQNLNGVPTNVWGGVGTATFGPVNSPVVAGNLNQAAAIFGPLQARTYDLLTQVALAQAQGANNFRLVRVTDGTDVAAAIVVLTNCITFTAKYTGTFGNSIKATVSPGSQATSYRVVVGAPGMAPETFDNIGAGLSANALWIAIANAINNGINALRGPSNFIVATAGVGTTAPAAATYTLVSGTDGATTINGTVLLGTDTTPRTGMYALRSTGCAVAILCDLSDSTTWATQVTFGLSEGIEMVGTGPSGDTISNALSTKSGAGIDSYSFKLCFGDWLYWNDTYNKTQRFVSPHGAVAGLLAALNPNQSPLNKQIQGISGTQKSLSNTVYVSAELQQLVSAGIDVVCNPCPGGAYFGVRIGHNSSSDPTINGDNYTRMTNYLAKTINAGMGIFIGQLQAANAIGQPGTPSADAAAVLNNFFSGLQTNGFIGSANGPAAWSVEIDPANNPAPQVALGNLSAYVQVQYQSVIERFFVSLQGGQTVQVTSVSVQQAA